MTPGVTDEAVEAADVAFWHDPGRESFRDALTAALPYIVADRDARIKALSVAMVTAVVPLEAILMSGTLKEHCPDLQDGIVKGIAAVRAALDPSP